jgi:hypothetical protein
MQRSSCGFVFEIWVRLQALLIKQEFEPDPPPGFHQGSYGKTFRESNISHIFTWPNSAAQCNAVRPYRWEWEGYYAHA